MSARVPGSIHLQSRFQPQMKKSTPLQPLQYPIGTVATLCTPQGLVMGPAVQPGGRRVVDLPVIIESVGVYAFCVELGGRFAPLSQPLVISGVASVTLWTVDYSTPVSALKEGDSFSLMFKGYGLTDKDRFSVGPDTGACPSGLGCS